MTDTIMLEAPARGGRISDLADGQGRILRLHDLTAVLTARNSAVSRWLTVA